LMKGSYSTVWLPPRLTTQPGTGGHVRWCVCPKLTRKHKLTIWWAGDVPEKRWLLGGGGQDRLLLDLVDGAVHRGQPLLAKSMSLKYEPSSEPLHISAKLTRSSELGTHKTVKARLWPWLEPFFRQMSVKPFKLFPSRLAAAPVIGLTATCTPRPATRWLLCWLRWLRCVGFVAAQSSSSSLLSLQVLESP